MQKYRSILRADADSHSTCPLRGIPFLSDNNSDIGQRGSTLRVEKKVTKYQNWNLCAVKGEKSSTLKEVVIVIVVVVEVEKKLKK